MSSHQCYVYQKDFEQNVIQGPAVMLNAKSLTKGCVQSHLYDLLEEIRLQTQRVNSRCQGFSAGRA